jgi:hypothetical protein
MARPRRLTPCKPILPIIILIGSVTSHPLNPSHRPFASQSNTSTLFNMTGGQCGCRNPSSVLTCSARSIRFTGAKAQAFCFRSTNATLRISLATTTHDGEFGLRAEGILVPELPYTVLRVEAL